MRFMETVSATLSGFKDISEKAGPFLLSGIIIGTTVSSYLEDEELSPGQTAWITLAAAEFSSALCNLVNSIRRTYHSEASSACKKGLMLAQEMTASVILPAAFTVGCLQVAFNHEIGDHNASDYTFVISFYAASTLSGAKYLYKLKNDLPNDNSVAVESAALATIATGLLVNDFADQQAGLIAASSGATVNLLVHTYRVGRTTRDIDDAPLLSNDALDTDSDYSSQVTDPINRPR